MKLKWFNLNEEGDYELKDLASVEEPAKEKPKKAEIKEDVKVDAPKRGRKKVAK